MSRTHYDVCILGAGMAGLTLARQLHRRKPDLSIALVEHRQFPVPEAVHKVGESTVEIAAHYLAETLGLKEHLAEEQLPKFGLRLFLRGEHPVEDDLAAYDEIGVSKVLPVPTYQIDRGRLENHLAQQCQSQGADLLAGTTVRNIVLQPGAHTVRVRDAQGERQIQAKYLIDSSGRRSWVRTQQALARPARHPNQAVWFRVDGRLDLDEWSTNKEWRGRCFDTPRRLSTNHFTGPGYWLWLIPLASNTTSVGVVFDPRIVAAEQINQHTKLMGWLESEHPLVAAQLEDAKPLDFHVLKDYAVSCQQVFSEQGWMLTGDAGVFADPFYSPGADFIAFANSFITQLITQELPAADYQRYQSYFLTFFSNTLSLYRGQYGGFGNRDMMVLKTIWDYSYYWGPLAKLFFSNRFLDTQFMSEAQAQLRHAATLNSGMQRQFRLMSESRARVGGESRFFDHHELPYFHQLKAEMLQGDGPNFGQQLADSVERLALISKALHRLMADVENQKRLPSLSELGHSPAFV